MKKYIISSIVVFILISFAIWYFYFNRVDTKPIINYRDIDSIVVVSPVKDSQISSPLVVTGRAKGMWFHEGVFTVILVDSDGNVISESHVSSQDDINKNDFIKFIGNIQFDKPKGTDKGSIIFKRDSQDDASAKDSVYRLPIIFK